MITSGAQVRLGAVTKLVRGISYKSSELTDTDNGVRMANLRNVGKGGGFRPDGYKQFTGTFKQEQVLQPGELLIANTDLSKAKDVLGAPFLVPHDSAGAVFSLDLTKIVPNEDILDRKYLYYFLQSPDARSFMKAHGQGITVMHLRMPSLPNLEIPVPSLDEQRRIVATLEDHLSRLDKALAEVRDSEMRLEVLKMSWLQGELAKALQENGSNPLGSIADTRLGKMLDSAKNVGIKTPYLRNMNVQWGRIDTSDLDEAPMTSANIEDLALQVGDLLVCEGGEPGRCAIWTADHHGPEVVAFQKALHRVRPDDDNLPEFIALVLEWLAKSNQLKPYITGTTIKHLPQEQLRKLPIPVLEKTLQSGLVSRFNLFNESLIHAKRELSNITRQVFALRRAVLADAFSGKLRGEEYFG